MADTPSHDCEMVCKPLDNHTRASSEVQARLSRKLVTASWRRRRWR